MAHKLLWTFVIFNIIVILLDFLATGNPASLERRLFVGVGIAVLAVCEAIEEGLSD